MKIIAVACFCLLGLASDAARPPDPVFDVTGPTVIGFLPPTTDADFDVMNDEAIAEDDFAEAWDGFVKWAETAGVRTETTQLRFAARTREKKVRIREKVIGYLLIDSTGRHKVLHGVRGSAELESDVCKFFASLPEKSCADQ
jgi:hypothetical protein